MDNVKMQDKQNHKEQGAPATRGEQVGQVVQIIGVVIDVEFSGCRYFFLRRTGQTPSEI